MKRFISAMTTLLTAGMIYGFLVGLVWLQQWLVPKGFVCSLWALGAPALGSSTAGLLALSAMLLAKTLLNDVTVASFMRILRMLYLPTLLSTSYWMVQYRFLSMMIPGLCMILFLVHPVGWQAAPYAAYWLIPMMIGFVQTRSLISRALATTFIAHAVGSVLFLYALPTVPAYWLSLLPVVALERCMGVGMILLTWHSVKLMNKITNYTMNRLVAHHVMGENA